MSVVASFLLMFHSFILLLFIIILVVFHLGLFHARHIWHRDRKPNSGYTSHIVQTFTVQITRAVPFNGTYTPLGVSADFNLCIRKWSQHKDSYARDIFLLRILNGDEERPRCANAYANVLVLSNIAAPKFLQMHLSSANSWSRMETKKNYQRIWITKRCDK